MLSDFWRAEGDERLKKEITLEGTIKLQVVAVKVGEGGRKHKKAKDFANGVHLTAEYCVVPMPTFSSFSRAVFSLEKQCRKSVSRICLV